MPAGAKTVVLEWLGRLMSARGRSGATRLSVRNLTRGTGLGDAIECAGSGGQRRKGLLGRSGLTSGEGLWIVPCEAVHTFFMKFSIDLIYLDRRRRVIKVRSGVAPWRISACLRAHSILELPVGTVRATQTERGDSLEILSPL